MIGTMRQQRTVFDAQETIAKVDNLEWWTLPQLAAIDPDIFGDVIRETRRPFLGALERHAKLLD